MQPRYLDEFAVGADVILPILSSMTIFIRVNGGIGLGPGCYYSILRRQRLWRLYYRRLEHWKASDVVVVQGIETGHVDIGDGQQT